MKKRLAYSPGRLVAILTFGVFGIINTEMGVVGIIPQIAETFGVTVPQAGWTVGVFALIVAVSAPVMPLLFSGTDRRTGSVVFAYDLNPRYGEQLPSADRTGPRSALPHPRNKPHAGAESAYRAQRPRRKRRLPDEGRFETLLDGPRPQRRRRAESRMTGSGNEEPKNRGNSGCECTSGVFICPSPTD